MNDKSYDVVVIGGGPAGYPAAIRAAQLGLSAVCIDDWKNEEGVRLFGGTCLNVGCIPSKALLESTELYHRAETEFAVHGISVSSLGLDVAKMQSRKRDIVKQLTMGIDALFKAAGVVGIKGRGKLLAGNRVEVTTDEGVQTIAGKHVVLATGSIPIELPIAKFDGKRIVDSTGALAFPEVPKHLVVVGGGVIGLELGSVWLRLGAKVTVLEMAPTILPGMDAEIVRQADRIFRKQGFEIRTGTRVTGAEREGDVVTVSVEGSEPIEADYVLVSVGRRAYTQGMGYEEAGIPMDRGVIRVDERYHTGVGSVYAIGDAIGGRMLAHKAEEEGVAAVENIAGKHGHVKYDAVANVVYTWPEIASVGMTEEEAKADGREYRVGKFPFSANGRARAMAETDGLVKVIADAKTDRLLGLHILGPRASDLIAEAALAIEFESSAEDIARSVHAHPTLPEAVKEAALAAGGRAIHI